MKCSVPSFAVAIACAILVNSPAYGLVQVTEAFDDDPAPRGWGGVNNRAAPQDYGFSTGDVTGTAVNPPGGIATAGGEIGGTVARAAAPANFYGVDLGGSLDPQTDAFYVSGVLNVHRDGGAGLYLGYSNGAASYGSGGDAANFLGLQLDDGDRPIMISFTPGGGRDRDLSFYDTPLASDVTVPFSMDYDPNAQDGKGAMEVTIDATTHTFNLGDNNDLAPFTHFGIFAVSADGGASRIWIDDLSYTSVNPIPEPASMLLFVCGGLGVLAAGGRRKK